MTNRGLNIAKQVALEMLYMNIEDNTSRNDYRTLYHPFVSDRIYIDENPNWREEKEELIYQAKDFFDLYDLIGHHFYFAYLHNLQGRYFNGLRIDKKDFGEALRSLWFDIRWNSIKEPAPKKIKLLFDYADKETLMTAEEREFIAKLPNEFEVYRAYQESSKDSFSKYDFFLSKETAVSKRKIYLDEDVIVETKRVKKENVLAYNKERQILVIV